MFGFVQKWFMIAVALFSTSEYMQVCVAQVQIDGITMSENDFWDLRREVTRMKRQIDELLQTTANAALAQAEYEKGVKELIKLEENVDLHHKSKWHVASGSCNEVCHQLNVGQGSSRKCWDCVDSFWPDPKRNDFQSQSQAAGQKCPGSGRLDPELLTQSAEYGPYFQKSVGSNEMKCGFYENAYGIYGLNHAKCSASPPPVEITNGIQTELRINRLCWCTAMTNCYPLIALDGAY